MAIGMATFLARPDGVARMDRCELHMAESRWDVVVVGAGVLGTFHAYFACQRGLRTLLIERGTLPGQASVRNFGLVIPSGMEPGDWHRRGLESAAIYRLLAEQMPIP